MAFQGERGAYGDDAIAHRWRGHAIPVPSWTFEHVVRAVRLKQVDYGVIPLENTVVGRIAMTHDVLRTAPELTIVDQIVVHVRHALLAPSGATLDRLGFVASHPVALAQCGRFLDRFPLLQRRESYDTAGAARDVAARANPAESAIASVSAAIRYRLQVIAEDIQDVPDNYTTFAIISAHPDAASERRAQW